MSLVYLECNQWLASDENRQKLEELWPAFKTENYPSCERIAIDLEDIPDWVSSHPAVVIKPIKKLKFITKDPVPNLNDGNRGWVKEFVKTVNQVVLPGYDLLSYDSICVEENACSEDIKNLLDKGWRIIAVLPQHGQRRPDYVLVGKGLN